MTTAPLRRAAVPHGRYGADPTSAAFGTRQSMLEPGDIGHRVVVAHSYLVPKPFRTLAVRSEEPRHAFKARAPYGCVHVVRTQFPDTGALAALAAQGRAQTHVDSFADIDYAPFIAPLPGNALARSDIVRAISAALSTTGLLGDDAEAYQRAVSARIDFLASYGAGFHNDVASHWTACLFWNLALAVTDVEFVMPHAGCACC